MTPSHPTRNEEEHNPDNLTPEQVGEGWRLLRKGEQLKPGDQYRDDSIGITNWRDSIWGFEVHEQLETYRRRVSPAPSEQPIGTPAACAPQGDAKGCPQCARLSARLEEVERDRDEATTERSKLTLRIAEQSGPCFDALAVLRHLEDGHTNCGCDIGFRIKSVIRALEAHL